MDILIVGAGISGCYIARKLVDEYHDVKVKIIDKRDHIAGNCYDYYDEDGILTHMYGPHYFRTNSEEQKNWLGQFTEWIPGEYIVKASINNELYSLPINLNTISKMLDRDVSEEDFKEYLKANRVNFDSPQNAYEQCLNKFGKDIYEMFFKGYTEKQWGKDPSELLPELTARIPLRFDHNDKYVNERFQVMPKDGYTEMVKKMIHHERISVQLGVDFFKTKADYKYDRLVYTGEIDRFFDYKCGKLQYRSLKFEKKNFKNEKKKQAFVQYNYPKEHDFTRSVEIKHVTGQQIDHTNIVYEYPADSGEPFYPFIDRVNSDLAQTYRGMAKDLEAEGVYFAGRLANYRYFNMDQALHAAEKVYDRLRISLK